MKKIAIILLTLGCMSSTMAQNSLNDYKYVIVPYKYDFLNEKDKYQLNSLTQFLFNKYGFDALMEDADLPEDLAKNRCLALKSDVIKEKGLFATKLKVQLKNCDGTIIYTTKIGSTREKEFKAAYTLALRNAFKEFEGLNYTYKANEAIMARATISGKSTSTEEIDKLKKEINALKTKQQEMVIQDSGQTVVEKPVEKKEVTKTIAKEPSKNVLYAQKIDNGYQLVDKTPRVVMVLLDTNLKNVFLVKDKNALVYKEDGFWYLSKSEGNQPILQTLNIKF